MVDVGPLDSADARAVAARIADASRVDRARYLDELNRRADHLATSLEERLAAQWPHARRTVRGAPRPLEDLVARRVMTEQEAARRQRSIVVGAVYSVVLASIVLGIVATPLALVVALAGLGWLLALWWMRRRDRRVVTLREVVTGPDPEDVELVASWAPVVDTPALDGSMRDARWDAVEREFADEVDRRAQELRSAREELGRYTPAERSLAVKIATGFMDADDLKSDFSGVRYLAPKIRRLTELAQELAANETPAAKVALWRMAVHGRDKPPGAMLSMPREHVPFIDREFKATTDCRDGHWELHPIVERGQRDGAGRFVPDGRARLRRECAVPSCGLSWWERV